MCDVATCKVSGDKASLVEKKVSIELEKVDAEPEKVAVVVMADQPHCDSQNRLWDPALNFDGPC